MICLPAFIVIMLGFTTNSFTITEGYSVSICIGIVHPTSGSNISASISVSTSIDVIPNTAGIISSRPQQR